MRKNLLIIFLLALPLSFFAKERTQSEAFGLASEFFKSQSALTRASVSPQLVAVSTDLIPSTLTRATSTCSPAFYIYNNGNSGFVFISGDDRMKPILAYSDKGGFVTENLPANIRSFLAMYVEEMNALDAMTEQPKTFAAPATRTTFPTSVSPLLGSIMYNQSTPYNDKCPDSSVTGCVATAMAQILKYHAYPTQGSGSHSYTTSTESYSCSFDYGTTTFDWDNMLDQYVTGEYTTTQADAVATLMYAAGVSVNMDYTTSESGADAFKVSTALSTYFKYDSNVAFVQRSYFVYDEWMDMIKTELSAGRPISYSGISSEGGHEFVFDGYDANDMVHVNWGWAGSDDGYFLISQLDPSSPGIGGGTNLGGGFTTSQGMTIGIQKPSDSSVYTSYFYCSSITLSSSTMQTGKPFTATANNIMNMSTPFTGECALILENNGAQTVISGIKSWSSIASQTGYESAGWSNVTIPTTTADGTYLFYAATRNPSLNDTWNEVRGVMGATNKYYCTVADGQATFTSYWGNSIDVTASVEVVHDLYSSLTGNFKLTYQNTNTSHDYYGNVSIALVSGDDIVSLLSTNSIFMTAGQAATTVDVATTISSDITAGSYQICAVAQWNGSYVRLSDEIDVTINSYSGTSTLSIKSFDVASTEIEEYSDLSLAGVFEATGDAPVYDGQVEAVVANSSMTTVASHSQYVFFTVGDDYNFSMTFNPNLSAGSYLVALFVNNQQANYPVSFTVKSGTGIENAEYTDAEKVILYPQPAEDILYVNAPKEVNLIEIYNTTGQLIKKEVLVGKGTQFNLPIGGFATGTYFVLLRSNSQVYRAKFVKN